MIDKLLKNHNKKIYWGSVFLWAGFIIYSSLSPYVPNDVGGYSINFNLMHFLTYFILCFLLTNALIRTDLIKTKNPFLASIFICFIFGALIEATQSFIPGRYASIGDVLYNASAIIIYPLAVSVARSIN